MAVKNPTQWGAPEGNGYVNQAGNHLALGTPAPSKITTQSGVDILTQGGEDLLINPNTFTFKSTTSWTKESKADSQWIPKGGYGYVYSNLNYQAAGQEGVPVIPGIKPITDNLGNFLVDNSGNNLVTNDTIVIIGKFLTQWTESGV